MQSKQAEDGGESCRVNRQRMEETELQSKQAEGGRERVADLTGRLCKGESCRVGRKGWS